ncbi:Protoheme IX farnesyltransferase [Diplonema papillatum]|nr:Protoheme IX farnesyltransferase [Diplonema papillatum]
MLTHSMRVGEGARLLQMMYRSSRRYDSSSVTKVVGKILVGDSLKHHVSQYAVLGKVKLTGLVAFTSSVGFMLSGGPVFSVAHAAVAAGTFLQSMSANTCNQIAEREYDKLMKRTTRRPMVTGTVSVPEAKLAATVELMLGTGLLYIAEPLSAGLGVACWALYVHCYTPLKRIHWLNTWAGAVVGAIPPVMGCVAAGASVISPSSLLLGSLLYLWQIPHFLALCYINRRDYKAAGFRMLSNIDVARAGTYALRYSLYTTAACTALPLYFDITSPFFAVESLAMGLYMTYGAYKFREDPLKNARKLFLISIAYLPLALILMLLHGNDVDFNINPKLLCPMATNA